ncbi:MAG: hypothetical protein ACYC4U_20840 [Pirellulaceae bacterium]
MLSWTNAGRIGYHPHMIRHTRRPKCIVCERPATRTVDIDARPASLCGDCPSPVEVYERAAELRESWGAARWAQARVNERRLPVCFDPVHFGED